MIHVTSLAERKALERSQVLALCVSTGDGGWDCYLAGETLPETTRTVVQALAEKKAVIDLYAAERRIAVRQASQPYATAEEMATWPIKRAEALKFQETGHAADAPTLTIEATYREVPLTDIVARVLDNAALLATAEAHIAGNAGKHKTAVITLANTPGTTAEQVDAYDLSTGWP